MCPKDIQVMHRPGGPYWENLFQSSWIMPNSTGQGVSNLRQRTQFSPIWTDLGK